MKKKFYSAVAIVTAFLPTIVFAQGVYTTVDTLINRLATWIPRLTGIVFALAILGFLWGLMLFIFSAGNEEKRSEGKGIMIWGLVAIFVMSSIYGIVRLAQNAVDVGGSGTLQPPTVQIR